MNQYSTEAAEEIEERLRAERRQKLIKSVIKVVFLLVLLAATASAYVYRADLSKSLTHLKLATNAEMQADRKTKAEAKAVEVQKLGQKRVDEFERTLK
jgi:hypothetical protein